MRKTGLIFGALILGAVAAANSIQASFLNAPHNEVNNLECKSCHEYPFDAWPGYSQDPNNPDDNIRNYICLRCHAAATRNPAFPDAPGKELHSSLALQGRIPDWTTKCVDCHDPHFQAQLDHYLSDASKLFLATGSYNNVSVNTSATPVPLSTITYSLTSNDSNWTAPAEWSKKSGTNGRGLILVADTSRPGDTFEIVAADSSTITVAGDISQVVQGSQFGVIYGQLIRSKVQLPATLGSGSKTVKFFNPIGGFTNTVTPDGICQVCHTATLNWKSDGTVSAGGDHYTGQRCTGCHSIASGFKGPNVDQTHVFLTVTGLCGNCHQEASIVNGIHKGICAKCHEGNPPTLALSGARNYVDAMGRGECTACHGGYFAGHSHHGTPAQNLQDSAECVTCHAAGQPMTVHLNNCGNCHDANSGARIVGARGWGDATVNNGAGGTCKECHLSYFDSHTYGGNHLNTAQRGTDLSAGVICSNCHQNNSDGAGIALDSWTDIRGLHDVATNGAGACATCHQSARQEVKDAITLGAGGGQVGCLTCHSSKAAGHANHVAMGVITGLASCNVCHDPGSVGTSSFYTDTLHGGCGVCHVDPNAGNYALIAGSSAEGRGRLDAGFGNPNTCGTCHSGIAADWYAHDVDHGAKGFVSLSADCQGCH
ncbi:MAG: hypothetical protein AB1568_16960, partial [Thermodesulfobacteriota bacterium]